MAGNLAVPNDFAAATGTVAASKIDDNFTQVESYVNTREVAVGLLAARPAAGVAGRWYVASDVSSGTAYVDTGVAWVQTGASVTGAASQLFRSYLAGLGLAQAADADHDITVAVGKARSDDDTADLVLGTAITKRIDAAWVVGNNEGGLDTGAVTTATWYHVFLITRPDTGVVDALFSASATAPTMPVNYTKKRRLGAMLTDGSSNLVAFIQDGDEFAWVAPTVLDFNGASGTAANTVTHRSPTGVVTRPFGYWANSSATTIYQSALDRTDLAPTITTASAGPLGHSQTQATGGERFAGVKTNTASQTRWRSTVNVTFQVCTHGWLDRRGRDA